MALAASTSSQSSRQRSRCSAASAGAGACLGDPGGTERGAQRALLIARAEPVACERTLRRTGARAGEARLGVDAACEHAVHALPLARQQLAGDRVAHEGVPEGVAVVPVPLEQPGAERVVQRRLERRIVPREGGGEQVVVHAPAGERGELQQLARRRVDAVEA